MKFELSEKILKKIDFNSDEDFLTFFPPTFSDKDLPYYRHRLNERAQTLLKKSDS